MNDLEKEGMVGTGDQGENPGVEGKTESKKRNFVLRMIDGVNHVYIKVKTNKYGRAALTLGKVGAAIFCLDKAVDYGRRHPYPTPEETPVEEPALPEPEVPMAEEPVEETIEEPVEEENKEEI